MQNDCVSAQSKQYLRRPGNENKCIRSKTVLAGVLCTAEANVYCKCSNL